MTLNDILGSISNLSNILTLVSSGLVAVLILKLRGDFAIFRSKILEDMERKFMSKPTTESDWPLSRREFQDFLQGAKEHRLALEQRMREHQMLIEQKIERLFEDRIRALEFDVRGARKSPV